MNRREFFCAPFIIKEIIVNDSEWITLFIPRRYVNDKYFLERHLRKFCEHLEVPIGLVMKALEYVKLNQDGQVYLALKGRSNGRILELLIGIADYYKVEYLIGWNIQL